MIDLDGLMMFVSRTAEAGVVSADTHLQFSQRGDRVVARYSGGSVTRGWLIGRWRDGQLMCRYAQRETTNAIHGGRSVCDVERLNDGRARVVEHFIWTRRTGSGTNVFDEIPTVR